MTATPASLGALVSISGGLSRSLDGPCQVVRHSRKKNSALKPVGPSTWFRSAPAYVQRTDPHCVDEAGDLWAVRAVTFYPALFETM